MTADYSVCWNKTQSRSFRTVFPRFCSVIKENQLFPKHTTNIKFDCFIISFDHFLQPKDNNTQHKSKISHVIFIHHRELSLTLVPWGHGTVIQFSMSDSMESSSPPAQVQMCWIASVKYLRRGNMYRYTQKTTDTFTDYKGILMEKAIVQACDTKSTWSSSYTQSPWLTERKSAS